MLLTLVLDAGLPDLRSSALSLSAACQGWHLPTPHWAPPGVALGERGRKERILLAEDKQATNCLYLPLLLLFKSLNLVIRVSHTIQKFAFTKDLHESRKHEFSVTKIDLKKIFALQMVTASSFYSISAYKRFQRNVPPSDRRGNLELFFTKRTLRRN